MLQPHSSFFRRHWLTDMCCLGGLILLFYCFWLGSYPVFTPDEGRYCEAAREMLVSGDFITPRVDGVVFLDKPILYYWMQAASLYLFGVNEWAIRLIPMLCGVLGCLLTYACGRQLFDRRTGILSAIILSTTYLYYGGAHYANLDLEVAFFISASLLLFLTGLRSSGRWRDGLIITSYVCAALAVLTKGLIGIVFPVMIVGIWTLLFWEWRSLKRIHLMLGLTLFMIIVAPWYVKVQQANPRFFQYFFVTQHIQRFLSSGTFNNASPFWFYMPVLMAGFFPWIMFLAPAITNIVRDVKQKRGPYENACFFLIWFVAIFVFFSIPRSKTVGYLLSAMPAAAMMTGHYLSICFDHPDRRSLGTAVLTLTAIGSGIAAAILLVVFKWTAMPPEYAPHLFIAAGLIMLTVVSAVLLWLCRATPQRFFVMCVISSVIFLLSVIVGASDYNRTSTKSLVTELRTLIKPDEEVINYFKFYQDLPLYLGKEVTVVANWNSPAISLRDNWTRELWYGMIFQHSAERLIIEDTFWEKWRGDKRVFVFIHANFFRQFSKQARSYFLVGKSNDVYLVSNQFNP